MRFPRENRFTFPGIAQGKAGSWICLIIDTANLHSCYAQFIVAESLGNS